MHAMAPRPAGPVFRCFSADGIQASPRLRAAIPTPGSIMASPPPPVLTPCIGVCSLDPQGYCDGCFRTGEEIGAWLSLSDAQRAHLMDVVLPEREARLPARGG